MPEARKLPTCVGFIMDGNRRWAQANKLKTLFGHHRGKETFKEMVHTVRDAHIAHAVFYAFSSENWQRSTAEVNYLLKLMHEMVEEFIRDVDVYRVRIRVLGDRSELPGKLVRGIADLEARSETYEDTTIWIALSYGGRSEILHAVNAAIAAGAPVDEEHFSQLLWGAKLPDPDIIVRTGGEQRLSNFMTWHSVYSELYFTQTYWPDFSKADFDAMLSWYEGRQRRKGK